MQQHYNGKKIIWEGKAKRVFLIIVCLVFASIGVYAYSPDEKVPFVFSILFFGIGGLFLLFQLLNPTNLFVTHKSKLGQEILSEQERLAMDELFDCFSYNDTGFIFEERLYPWQDIATVFAFKRDLITTDDVYIDIFMKDKSALKLGEPLPGWFKFIEHLDAALPVDKNWWQNVVHAAFAINLTLVYDSEGRTKEECEARCYK